MKGRKSRIADAWDRMSAYRRIADSISSRRERVLLTQSGHQTTKESHRRWVTTYSGVSFAPVREFRRGGHCSWRSRRLFLWAMLWP
jgi:hypothetical protein